MNIRSQKKKLILGFSSLFLVAFLIAGVLGMFHYRTFYTPNIETPDKENVYVNISDKDLTVKSVIRLISEVAVIRNTNSFEKAAEKMGFKMARPGRYEIKHRMSNIEVIRMMQQGIQTPVKVTFNNIRTKEQLASRLSKQLMADSTEIVTLLNDSSYLAWYNLTPETAISVFLPNTYEFYWSTTAEKLFERMYEEYKDFWTGERLEKAAMIPLTPTEVITLASIVEEETKKSHEYPVVAGLYINRLNQNMALQADPTVKFAVGDFGLRRILNVHLKTESPYNTYRNKGLPPGPIRTPSIEVIDAVLDYEKHDYIFMAAKETFNGEHNFARTLAEHNKNANKYRQALNKRGIYK